MYFYIETDSAESACKVYLKLWIEPTTIKREPGSMLGLELRWTRDLNQAMKFKDWNHGQSVINDLGVDAKVVCK